MKLASLRVRLIAMVYEALLLAALMLAMTALFVALVGDAHEQPLRSVLRAFLLLVAGIYCVWSWTGGRRTLAMRTWRIRVVDRRGAAPAAGTAVLRYIYAVLGIGAGALGIAWALFDRERQFLHDRLAGTRIVAD